MDAVYCSVLTLSEEPGQLVRNLRPNSDLTPYRGTRQVIHPKTMTPAVADSIPIFIRNTFNPTYPGTRIFVSSASTIDREKYVGASHASDGVRARPWE